MKDNLKELISLMIDDVWACQDSKQLLNNRYGNIFGGQNETRNLEQSAMTESNRSLKNQSSANSKMTP